MAISRDEITAGIQNANINESGMNFLLAEIFVMSLIIGGVLFDSFTILILSFFLLLVGIIAAITLFPKMAIAILVLLTLADGAIGWVVGSWISTDVGIGLCMFALMLGAGFHYGGYSRVETS